MANKIRTTVKVEARGFSEERFLSIASYNNIPMYDVTRGDNGRLSFVTTPKGFKGLKPYARKTGTRLRIVKKSGAGFFAARLKRRKSLVFGLFFFIFALYGLSSFVWKVEAEGAAKYPPEEIIAFLNENGLKFGTFRYRIDTGSMERLILSHFPDIAWASVEITGTRAVAHVAEVIPLGAESAEKPSGTPSDITAKAGGVIERVIVRAGAPTVKIGDIVCAGDTLVSGELKIGTEDTSYVSSFVEPSAEVWARRFYEYRFSVPLSYPVKNFTGNMRRHYSIMVFGFSFGLPRPSAVYRAYTVEGAEKQLCAGKNHPLPFSLYTEVFREYTAGRESRTAEEAEQVARAATERKILKELPDARIIGRDYVFVTEDNYVNIRVRITAIERIDKKN